MIRPTIIVLAASVLAACSGISTQCSSDDLCNTAVCQTVPPLAVLEDSQQHPAVNVLSSVIRAAGTLGGGLAIGRGMSDIKLF